MPTLRKVLGQVDVVAAATPAALYTVPAGGSTVCSTLTVCGYGGVNTFSARVRIAGAAVANKQLVFSGQPVSSNQTVAFTAGLTLGAGDIVEVAITAATGVAFSLFGEETT